jgi:hypothetical protein
MTWIFDYLDLRDDRAPRTRAPRTAPLCSGHELDPTSFFCLGFICSTIGKSEKRVVKFLKLEGRLS